MNVKNVILISVMSVLMKISLIIIVNVNLNIF